MDDAALATQGVAELGELLHQALGELGAGDAISAELTLLGAIETLDELEAAVEPAEEWPALDGLLPLDLDGLRPLELDGPPAPAPVPALAFDLESSSSPPTSWFERRAERGRTQRGWLKWVLAMSVEPQVLFAQRVRPGPAGDSGDLVPVPLALLPDVACARRAHLDRPGRPAAARRPARLRGRSGAGVRASDRGRGSGGGVGGGASLCARAHGASLLV